MSGVHKMNIKRLLKAIGLMFLYIIAAMILVVLIMITPKIIVAVIFGIILVSMFVLLCYMQVELMEE